jgi:hypothetical protein
MWDSRCGLQRSSAQIELGLGTRVCPGTQLGLGYRGIYECGRLGKGSDSRRAHAVRYLAREHRGRGGSPDPTSYHAYPRFVPLGSHRRQHHSWATRREKRVDMSAALADGTHFALTARLYSLLSSTLADQAA